MMMMMMMMIIIIIIFQLIIWNYPNKAFNTLNMNNIQNLNLFLTFLHTATFNINYCI